MTTVYLFLCTHRHKKRSQTPAETDKQSQESLGLRGISQTHLYTGREQGQDQELELDHDKLLGDVCTHEANLLSVDDNTQGAPAETNKQSQESLGVRETSKGHSYTWQEQEFGLDHDRLLGDVHTDETNLLDTREGQGNGAHDKECHGEEVEDVTISLLDETLIKGEEESKDSESKRAKDDAKAKGDKKRKKKSDKEKSKKEKREERSSTKEHRETTPMTDTLQTEDGKETVDERRKRGKGIKRRNKEKDKSNND